MTKIEMGRVYRTRDGREVRIYAVDGLGDKPVHGAILYDSGWSFHCWSSLGDWAPQDCAATPLDLIEVKPRIKREVWVNVYPDHIGMVCCDKEEADNATGAKSGLRIACVRLTIDCEEGTGL